MQLHAALGATGHADDRITETTLSPTVLDQITLLGSAVATRLHGSPEFGGTWWDGEHLNVSFVGDEAAKQTVRDAVEQIASEVLVPATAKDISASVRYVPASTTNAALESAARKLSDHADELFRATGAHLMAVVVDTSRNQLLIASDDLSRSAALALAATRIAGVPVEVTAASPATLAG